MEKSVLTKKMQDRVLRDKIAKELPKEAFKPRPRGLFAIFFLIFFISGSTYGLLFDPYEWHFMVKFPLALILGGAYFVLWNASHEILHGSVVKNKTMRIILAQFGMLVFGYSSKKFLVEHFLHHKFLTIVGKDLAFTSVIYKPEKNFLAKFYFSCSSFYTRLLGVLFIGIAFEIMAYKNFSHSNTISINLKNENIKSFAILSLWLALCFLGGWSGSFFAVLLPIACANFLWGIETLAHHFLTPTHEEHEDFSILEATIDQKAPRWLDFLTLNGSHHLEHHLFPSMNWKYLPLVRQGLLKHAPEQFRCVSYWKLAHVLFTKGIIRHAHKKDVIINPKTLEETSTTEIQTLLGLKNP